MNQNNTTKYLSREQVNRLQGLLKMKGHDSGTLARVLGQPRSTVIAVINGRRRTPSVRAQIAAFLGLPVDELFGNALHNELDADSEILTFQN